MNRNTKVAGDDSIVNPIYRHENNSYFHNPPPPFSCTHTSSQCSENFSTQLEPEAKVSNPGVPTGPGWAILGLCGPNLPGHGRAQRGLCMWHFPLPKWSLDLSVFVQAVLN